MEEIFLKVFNMSIAAGWLILAVILLRLCFRRMPKWVCCLLWAVVAVRLVCPFSIESAVSLIPSRTTLDAHNVRYETPQIYTGFEAFNGVVNPVLEENFTPELGDSVNPLYVWMWVLSVVWVVGMAVLLLYAAYTTLRVYRTVRERVPLSGQEWEAGQAAMSGQEQVSAQERVYLCDHVDSPFILGIFSPKIFLPSGMDPDHMPAVIAHEKAHISRKDHLWKPLGFLILTVYWFHPLCWVAYILLCRDIELACDEKVIAQMDLAEKKAYSTALLDCSRQRRWVTVCPLAFGEVSVKERVKSVLNYRKPAFWVTTAALIVCVAVGVCFLTDPVSKAGEKESMESGRTLEELSVDYTLEEAKKDGCLVMENGSVTSGQETFDGFLEKVKKQEPATLRIVEYYELGDPAGYDPAHYEEIKDDYPALYVKDVIYEDGGYRVVFYADGELHSREYAFLLEDHFEASSPDAVYSTGDVWFLCDREGVTYHEVMMSLASSQWGAAIPNDTVYRKLNYKQGANASQGEQPTGAQEAEGPSEKDFTEDTPKDPQGASWEDSLEKAITEAILDRNRNRYAKGSFACESHFIYGMETYQQRVQIVPYDVGKTGSFESEKDTEDVAPEEITVYMSVLYKEFKRADIGVEVTGGGCNPAALTFRRTEEGAYELTEYWEPDPVPDNLADRFPESIIQKMKEHRDTIYMEQACYAQVVEYWQIDTAEVIEKLLDVMPDVSSSTATSSNPYAYMSSHGHEYSELLKYGNYTLQYCYDELSKGDRTDLRGQIMRCLIADLEETETRRWEGVDLE